MSSSSEYSRSVIHRFRSNCPQNDKTSFGGVLETPAQSRITLSSSDDSHTSDKQVTVQDGDDSSDGHKDSETENREGSFRVITRPLLSTAQPTSSTQSASFGRKHKPVPEAEKAALLSLANARLTEPDDHCLSQAKIWAHELKSVDARQELLAKKAISDI